MLYSNYYLTIDSSRLPVLKHDFINIGEYTEGDMMQSEVSEEEFNKYISIMLLYYAAAKKDISEQDIVRKIQDLDGKGSKVMTILEKRNVEIKIPLVKSL